LLYFSVDSEEKEKKKTAVKMRNMSDRSTGIWVGIGLLGLMVVTLYFGLRQHPSSFDDAYITYRYARNIALGRGFVYNIGEPVLGTTTPLYTLILAGLSTIWADLPVLSHVVGVLAWVLCIPTTYGIGQTDGHKFAGFIAASIVALNALFLNVLGMETSLYVLLVLLTFYFYLLEKPIWAALFAGLAFLMRWDGILVVAVLLFAEIQKRKESFLRAGLVSACIIIPWLVYSYLTFGSVFPNSFFAKAGQGWNQELGAAEIGSFARGSLLIANSAFAENSLFILYPIFSIFGIYSAYRNRVRWWPILLWSAAYFAGYVAVGVLRFDWYYPPLVPAIALLVAEGITTVAGFVSRRLGLTAGRVVLVTLFFLCLIPSLDWLLNIQRTEMTDYSANYVEVGEWLREHTPPDSSVALIEIGIIGLYSDRQVVDTMGLVSPEMIGHLEDWLQTLQFAINYYWPDYVVALRNTAWDDIVNEPWFEEAYTLEKSIEKNPKPLRIYRRRSDFPLHDFALDSHREVWFDGVLSLQNFRTVEDHIKRGNNLHVQLDWESESDIDTDYRLQFDLLDASDGQRWPIANNLQPMRGGNPTQQWLAGDSITDDHTLTIPDDVTPGFYLLQLVVSGQDGPVPITAAGGAPLSQIVVGPIQVGDSIADIQEPLYPVNASFAENVDLIGYDMELKGDNSLVVTAYWQATDEISSDYTIFAHLLSPEGTLVAQHDGSPPLPTSSWAPGVRVIDSHTLVLPEKLTGNDYQLRLGLYHWPDLARVPVVDSGCLYAKDHTLLVGIISFDGIATHDKPDCQNLHWIDVRDE